MLHAIREYEQSKWKVIGQKVGKPAKVGSDPVLSIGSWRADMSQACEQYARENFSKDEIAGKVKPPVPGKEVIDGKEL